MNSAANGIISLTHSWSKRPFIASDFRSGAGYIDLTSPSLPTLRTFSSRNLYSAHDADIDNRIAQLRKILLFLSLT